MTGENYLEFDFPCQFYWDTATPLPGHLTDDLCSFYTAVAKSGNCRGSRMACKAEHIYSWLLQKFAKQPLVKRGQKRKQFA